eukprot:TRINITY_DN4267_c0_g1_i1.p1 TRINITY_DN4267_c0_g1~~TRINITY_DN4267_c0_g1_i1.p1  ORF type:complete len:387 (-),score=95.40 TRINITY_DN4267_c0_g1_i1:332-1492(-)
MSSVKMAKKRKRESRDEGGEPGKKRHRELDIDCISSDAKTELISYVQIKLGRSLNKGEIVFMHDQQQDGTFVSTVELASLDGGTAVGEPKRTLKEAEMAAAFAILQERRDDIMELNNESARQLPRDENGDICARPGESRTTERQAKQFTNREQPQILAYKASTREPKNGKKRHREIDIDCISSDAKTELISYVQIKLGRSLNKGEIVFMNEQQQDGMFVSTVELISLDGGTAVSEPQMSHKEAEMAAAFAMLQERRDDILELNEESARQLPRDKNGDICAGERKSTERHAHKFTKVTNKEHLQIWACKTGTRELRSGDIKYLCEPVGDGFQGSVQLVHLPEPYCDQVFTGEVQGNKRNAEQNVAAIALAELSQESALQVQGKPSWC